MPPFVLPAGITHDVARTRAFYLLKKYTSATSLQRAIGLYRDFLRDFEHEIRKPEHVADSMWNTYQEDLLYFLRYLEPMEHAEPLLASPLRRTEAFALLREAVDFSAFMWGRRYQEWGASEPGSLYYELGYRYLSYDSIDVFGKAQLSAALISLMSTTISHDGVKRGVVYLADNHGARTTKRWTYEGIFFDVLSLNRIPTILFPPHLPSCPP
ncbi:Imm71 family immunity protein, partial [Caballeronia grimmiae]